MKLFAIGAFALASLAASSAAAQAQANPGPVIPGVCIYHHDRLLAVSTAGTSLITGMQRLQQEVGAELGPYQQFIQSESAALQQGRGSIPQDQFAQREQALQARYQEAQGLAQTRDGELRYTLALQRQAISQAADPIVQALYAERGCGILLSGEAVITANASMDITETAIQRLNASLPTLPPFSRSAVPPEMQQ
jgi:Skp family chaperone for outer membrane proteins